MSTKKRANFHMFRKENKLSGIARGGVLLCCFIIAVVMSGCSHARYSVYQESMNYTIDDLTWNTMSGAFSRTSYITPVNLNCEEKRIQTDDLNSIFQIADYKNFLSEDSEHHAIFENDELHSIKSVWRFPNGIVFIIIDPNNRPDFLLADESEKQVINGYTIAARKSNMNAATYEIDLGLEKNGIGIWIFGNSECKEQIDKLYNLVLNSKMDLSRFEN